MRGEKLHYAFTIWKKNIVGKIKKTPQQIENMKLPIHIVATRNKKKKTSFVG